MPLDSMLRFGVFREMERDVSAACVVITVAVPEECTESKVPVGHIPPAEDDSVNACWIRLGAGADLARVSCVAVLVLK